jgi:hypothetical protein
MWFLQTTLYDVLEISDHARHVRERERDGLLQALEAAKASIMIHQLVACFVDRLFVNIFPWYCHEYQVHRVFAE